MGLVEFVQKKNGNRSDIPAGSRAAAGLPGMTEVTSTSSAPGKSGADPSRQNVLLP